MKQALIRERIGQWGKEYTSTVTHALPFFRSAQGVLIHRVRSGQLHRGLESLGRGAHISIRFWCGNGGSIGSGRRTGELMATSPDRAVHCAICEGKAIGAGMDGAREINGRKVLFQPRI